MSDFSTTTPLGSVNLLKMGSSEYVAKAGASSVKVYTIFGLLLLIARRCHFPALAVDGAASLRRNPRVSARDTSFDELISVTCGNVDADAEMRPRSMFSPHF